MTTPEEAQFNIVSLSQQSGGSRKRVVGLEGTQDEAQFPYRPTVGSFTP